MHPWLFTKWLSEYGLSDLIAAIGTGAATGFAVWQAGAANRDRRQASKVAIQIALGTMERGVEVLSSKGATPAYVGAQCASLHATLLEIPIVQMQDEKTVEGLMMARSALHVIADRAARISAASAAGNRLAVMFTTATQREELMRAANILRVKLSRPMHPMRSDDAVSPSFTTAEIVSD